MEDLFFLITLTTLGFCILGLSWFAGSDAPFVPTKFQKIRPLLKRLGIRPGQVFYELGSGDGRMVLEAARLGARAYGVEQSWLRVWYARYLAWKGRVNNAIFYHGDIFRLNYFPADFVYVFLLPEGVKKLEAKLTEELKPGAMVITQTFHFRNWQPTEKINLSRGEQPISKDGRKPGDFWIYRVGVGSEKAHLAKN